MAGLFDDLPEAGQSSTANKPSQAQQADLFSDLPDVRAAGSNADQMKRDIDALNGPAPAKRPKVDLGAPDPDGAMAFGETTKTPGEYLGRGALSGLVNVFGSGARLLGDVYGSLFGLNVEDAETLAKDGDGTFDAKKYREGYSPNAILERFAGKSQDLSSVIDNGASPQVKATYGDLSYTTLDPAKAAYLSPIKVTHDILESLPSTVAMAIAVRFGGTGAAAAYEEAIAGGLTKEAAQKAAISVAAKRITMTGAASEGAIGYAQQATQTEQQVNQLPQETIEKSPEYQGLLSEGFKPDAARGILAERAGNLAGMVAGLVDAGTNLASGPVLGRIIGEGGRLPVRAGKAFLTEGLQEATQGPGEQLGQNYAVQKYADPSQSLWDGLLEQAVQGFMVGGVTGGVAAGAFGADEHEDGAAPAAPPRPVAITPGSAMEAAAKTAKAAAQAQPQGVPPAGPAGTPPAAPGPVGVREAASKAPVHIEQGDINSQIDTGIITTGRAKVQDALATAEANTILTRNGWPGVGQGVTIYHAGGEQVHGVVEDAFSTSVPGANVAADGLRIKLADGRMFETFANELANAGAKVGPRAMPSEAGAGGDFAGMSIEERAAQNPASMIGGGQQAANPFDIVPTGDGTRTSPIEVSHADHVDQAAGLVNTDPTDAQKEAGNYQKGHIRLHGLDIALENPAGSERSGVDPDGASWKVTMPAHYGYIKRTVGADEEQVDTYIGPNPQSQHVFVVDQQHADSREFDEHKVMLGFDSALQAKKAYLAAFSDDKGHLRLRQMHAMDMAEFKAKLAEGAWDKPLSSTADPYNFNRGNEDDIANSSRSTLHHYAKGAGIETEGRTNADVVADLKAKGYRAIQGGDIIYLPRKPEEVADHLSTAHIPAEYHADIKRVLEARPELLDVRPGERDNGWSLHTKDGGFMQLSAYGDKIEAINGKNKEHQHANGGSAYTEAMAKTFIKRWLGPKRDGSGADINQYRKQQESSAEKKGKYWTGTEFTDGPPAPIDPEGWAHIPEDERPAMWRTMQGPKKENPDDAELRRQVMAELQAEQDAREPLPADWRTNLEAANKFVKEHYGLKPFKKLADAIRTIEGNRSINHHVVDYLVLDKKYGVNDEPTDVSKDENGWKVHRETLAVAHDKAEKAGDEDGIDHFQRSWGRANHVIYEFERRRVEARYQQVFEAKMPKGKGRTDGWIRIFKDPVTGKYSTRTSYDYSQGGGGGGSMVNDFGSFDEAAEDARKYFASKRHGVREGEEETSAVKELKRIEDWANNLVMKEGPPKPPAGEDEEGDGGAEDQGEDTSRVREPAQEEKQPAKKPLNRLQFNNQYVQHIDIRGRKSGNALENRAKIMREGFNAPGGVNALPPYRGGEANNVIDKAYKVQKGDVVYLAPKGAWTDGGNGPMINKGWKPEPYEAIVIQTPELPMYDQYLAAFNGTDTAPAETSTAAPEKTAITAADLKVGDVLIRDGDGGPYNEAGSHTVIKMTGDPKNPAITLREGMEGQETTINAADLDFSLKGKNAPRIVRDGVTLNPVETETKAEEEDYGSTPLKGAERDQFMRDIVKAAISATTGNAEQVRALIAKNATDKQIGDLAVELWGNGSGNTIDRGMVTMRGEKLVILRPDDKTGAPETVTIGRKEWLPILKAALASEITESGDEPPVSDDVATAPAADGDTTQQPRERFAKMGDVGEEMAGKRAQAKDAVEKDKTLDKLLERTREATDFETVLPEDATSGAHVYALAIKGAFKTFLEWQGTRAGGGRRKYSDNFSDALQNAWDGKGYYDISQREIRENAAEYIGLMNTLRLAISGAKNVAEIRDGLKAALLDENKEPTQYRINGNDLFSKLEAYTRRYDLAWQLEIKDSRTFYQSDDRQVPTKATPLRRFTQKLDDIERDGLPDRRNGKDVDGKEFMDTFGFRGVEFGDWVTGKERQQHVNLAYDSLYDFAETIGIPLKGISLGGKLGLAFGSRGRGRHAAHYEPDNVVINLTRTNGDGSVSHEWGHALDYALRNKGGQAKLWREAINNNLAFTWDEARALSTLDSILRGNTTITNRKMKPVELGKYYVSTLWAMQGWGGKRTTQFAREAEKLGKDYWAKPEELWARSFEAFTYDSLTENKGTSPYLVNNWVEEGVVTKDAGYRGTPYPTAAERQNFNQMWRSALDGLQWSEDGTPSIKPDADEKIADSRDAVAKALQAVNIEDRWAELQDEKEKQKKEHDDARAARQAAAAALERAAAQLRGDGEGGNAAESSEGSGPAESGGQAGSDGRQSRPGDAGRGGSADGEGRGAGAEGGTGSGAVSDQREIAGGVGGDGNVPAFDGDRDGGSGSERGVRGQDFVIPDGFSVSGSPKVKANRNIDAIRLMQAIEARGGFATAAEQATLAKFIGWGGLPQVFDDRNSTFAKERADLRELLTPAEWDSAKASTINAHYTSEEVVKATWGGLKALGFNGAGTMLEPGMGIGNFMGMRPTDMVAPHFTGVELDGITGRMARLLYPNAEVFVKGFEDTALPASSFNAVIGNVPFADIKPFDKEYNPGRKMSLHNYFIFKSLNLLKPGGVAALVTTHYTLDAIDPHARTQFSKVADFLGAVRLPDSAFKDNAGTEVVTDILFFRRRMDGEEVSQPTNYYFESARVEVDGSEQRINAWIEAHPNAVLGTHSTTGTMYRKDAYNVKGRPGVKLGPAIEEAIKTEIVEPATNAGLLYAATGTAKAQAETFAAPPSTVKDGAFFVDDNGRLLTRQGERAVAADVKPLLIPRIKKMVALRDLARTLLNQQMSATASEEVWKATQQELNDQYDAYVETYGFINKVEISKRKMPGSDEVREYRRYPNLAVFRSDPDVFLVSSLEKGDDEKGSFVKAAIMSDRVVQPTKVITHVENSVDALAASLNLSGKIDLDYMAKIAGKTADELLSELKGSIFLDPMTGQYQTDSQYLSGNVRRALIAAKGAAEKDARFKENVAALEGVQPEDLPPSQIDVRLGASWVPKADMEAFITKTFGTRARVKFNVLDGSWKVDLADRYAAEMAEWGTAAVRADKILLDTLNQRTSKVTRKVDDKDVTDITATVAAQEMQQKLKDKFSEWVWEDGERAERLARLYNDTYNNSRTPSYDGSHLTLPNSSTTVMLRSTQKNAVWRALTAGNILLDHTVGAGKTFTMVAIAQESKRMGQSHKPMLAVPNHMLEQISREYMLLYPNAEIIVADKDNFGGDERRRFVARVATGNWDAVIMPHSALELVPMSPRFQADFLEEQVRAYQEMLEGEDDRATIKQIQKQIKRREEKVTALLEAKDKDRGVTFEEMGIDQILLDEAHLFKNLEFGTKMREISVPASQRAEDMYMKTRYIDRLTPGRNLTFATGTPIANSMSEMFTLQRYLDPRGLADVGLTHFDAWAAQFGDTVTQAEIAPDGAGARLKTRFARFRNIPELIAMYRKFADVVTKDDLKANTNIKLPEIEGGLPRTVIVPGSDALRAYVADLAERAEKVRSRLVDPKDDNMLKISSDGRKAALDMRLVDPSAPADPERKAVYIANDSFEVWKAGASRKLTQVVFLDLSTPTNDGSFNVYDDIRALLLKKGVPRSEIAFIHQADTDQKKGELFAAMREGRVRILLGSTEKMGVGTNVQRLLKHLRHADAPWRPSDLEQRNGRIERQGNLNDEIGISQYVTEGSFDAYMWQGIERKARFINAIKKGDPTVRNMEDIDEQALSYAEVKALASGNPLILEKAKVDAEVEKLTRLSYAHRDKQISMRSAIAKAEGFLEGMKKKLAGLQEDAKKVISTKGDDFKAEFGGKKYDKRADAEKQLWGLITKANEAAQAGKGQHGTYGDTPLGEIGGFKVSVSTEYDAWPVLVVHQAQDNEINLEMDGGGRGALRRLEYHISAIESRIENTIEAIEETQTKLPVLKSQIGLPFDKADALAAALEKQGKIDATLMGDKAGVSDGTSPPENGSDEDLEPSHSLIGDFLAGRKGGAAAQEAPTSTGTEQVGLGADLKRMIDLFGPKMYGENMPDVTAKELLQNSFDGVKAALQRGDLKPGEGVIDIFYDKTSRQLTFRDNGAGMTPQIVKDAFLTVAGTDKGDLATEDRSGGFGVAKLAFIFGNDGLFLRTVRDGVETKLETSSKELLDGKAELKTSRSTEKNGTTVTVTFPEKYLNPKTGEKEGLRLPYAVERFAALDKPLIGDVQVNVAEDIAGQSFTDLKPLPIGRNLDLSQQPKVTTAHFVWGDVDVYFGNPASKYGEAHQVLSSGLYQFTKSIGIKPFDWKRLPYDITLNVKPSVSAESPMYPFNNQREDFSPKVKEDIAALSSYLQRWHAAKDAAGYSTSFAGVHQMPITRKLNTSGYTGMFKDLDLARLMPDRGNTFDFAPDITIRDGKTKIGGKDRDFKAEMEKAEGLSAEKFSFPEGSVPTDAPLFHTNLTTEVISEAARRYGADELSARRFLAGIGTIVQDFRDALVNVKGYEDWANKPVGVSLDKSYHGVHIHVPFNAFFLNPLAVRTTTDAGHAASYMHTMIHEAVHTHEKGHDEGFTMALGNLEGAFEDANPGIKAELMSKIVAAIERDREAFDAMRKVYDDETTRNFGAGAESNARNAVEPGSTDGILGRSFSRRGEGDGSGVRDTGGVGVSAGQGGGNAGRAAGGVGTGGNGGGGNLPPIDYDGFSDKGSEDRFNAARKNLGDGETFMQQAKDWWARTRAGFSRHWQHLPNLPVYANLQQRLRVLEASPDAAHDRMMRYLRNMVDGLDPKEYDVFSRKVILDDLSFEATQDHDLPFGMTPDSVAAELRRIDDILAQRPDLMQRVRARKVFVADVARQMVETGVLNKEQALNPTYYRHVVIEYAQAAMVAARSGGVKDRLSAPYWARRMGSTKDIVSNLLHAEADWLYKALTNIAEAKTIQWLKDSDHNVRDRVMEAAKNYNKSEIDRLIREDIATNGFNDAKGRLTSPMDQEYKAFAQKIAMGMDMVKEALDGIAREEIPDDLQDVADNLSADIRDDRVFDLLNWILENNKPGALGAATAFGGIAGRRQWVKDKLGEDYANPNNVKSLIKMGFAPDGEYVTWQPDEGRMMFLAKTLPEHFMDRQLRGIAGMSTADIAKMIGAHGDNFSKAVTDQIDQIREVAQEILAMGGQKYEMVLPKEVADTLNHLKDGKDDNIYSAILETPVRAWKVWTLFNPRRWLKYGLNNLSGDLDAVVAGQPRILGQMPAAVKELFNVTYKKGDPSQDYLDAVERGVFSSNITTQELGDIASMSDFDHLIDKATDADVAAARKFLLTPVGRAWNASKGAQNFRENWLRYAAYKYALGQLQAGKTVAELGYGASNPAMLDAVTDQRDQAALWARDLLGDYGAISKYGAGLRKFLMPFWSWTEINTKRYYRLTANAYGQGIGKGIAQTGVVGGVIGARTTAYLFTRMFMVYALIQMWNHLVHGDDEDKLSLSDQQQLHIILGTTPDGKINTLRLQGALSDALSWFGFQDAVEGLLQVQHGRASLLDVLGAMAKAPVVKLINGLTPAITSPITLLTGKSLYPDPFKPRNIRDRWREAFQTFSFENEYDAITGKPSRGYLNSLAGALVYRRDPGEIAYNNVRDLSYRWLEKEKGEAGAGGAITDRSTALYNWRTALRYGDQEAAKAALARLKELHVNAQSRHESLMRAHPLGAIAMKDRHKFKASLSARETAQLDEAREWYKETFLGHNGKTPAPEAFTSTP